MNPLMPLLGLLARGDAHGYELKRTVESEFVPHWRIDFAQLYRSLAKLHAQGLVRVRAADGIEGPARKVYAITTRGRNALEKWLQAPAVTDEELWVKTHLAIALDYGTHMPFVIAGSDDPLLAHLARLAHAQTRVVGSTAGLFALAEQRADLVGAHLREPNAANYNVSFVQHLVPEQDVLLVNLAIREYGLMVSRDNPKKIRGVRDLARQNAQLMNRTPGSGARLWLQRHVCDARLDPASLPGWSSSAATYDAVAHAILTGAADAGPGLRAVAEQWNLDFVALGEERFDLALPRRVYESERAAALLRALHGQEFSGFAKSFAGYDLTRSGRVVTEVKYGFKSK